MDTIELRPVDEATVKDAAEKINGNSSVSCDWLRPRHNATMSSGAREALAWLLNQFETRKRWLEMIRDVLMIVGPKKIGGSRLIGLANAIYRVWAKIRYNDCRQILEHPLSRQFLASAPRRGAIDAAFDIAWDAESASAKGQQATCVLVVFLYHILTTFIITNT